MASTLKEPGKEQMIMGDTPTKRALRKLVHHKGAIFGMTLLALIVLSALLAPVLAPYAPDAYDAGNAMKGPQAGHPLGTDQLGRDVLSRILWGGRLSLQVGLYAVIIASVGGLVLGTLAGYFGGYVDEVIMRFMDIWLAFPGLLLSLAVVIVLGPGMLNLTIAIGISGIPRFSRIIRGSVLSAKENLYVEGARAEGAYDLLIMVRHILPNVIAPFMVYATLYVGTAILTGTSLSFLGLGAEPPTPEWGLMLSTGRDFMRRAWWLTTFPGVFIMATVIAVNVLGDGLRDVLDPRLD